MMLRQSIFVGLLWMVTGVSALQAAGSVQQVLVPTPRAQVMAVTAASRPFLSAAKTRQPVMLAASGYAESEWLMRGYANVYDWSAEGSVTVQGANQTYATRLLVRRPLDARRFSGRVIVELLEASGSHETAPLWGLSYAQFVRRGDVWVGVTVKSAGIAALQLFDAARYRQLSLANSCDAPISPESGLAWDVIAQVGALLRSASRENPLADLSPQRVIAAGYGEAGAAVTTFANALHERLRLGDTAPIFDGYFSAAPGRVAAALNPCAGPLAETDIRNTFKPRAVPIVVIATESDFQRVPALRRGDSDLPTDLYRYYEIAGAAQGGTFPAGLPAAADLARLGGDAAAACREPRSDLPVRLVFHAIWQQLDELLLQNLPMSSVARFEVDAALTLQRDAEGNALGGWRLPQIEVPLARFAGRSSPAEATERAARQCEVTGSRQGFSAAKLKSLYQDRKGYLRRFNAAVDLAVQARLLVADDAQPLKAAVAAAAPAF